MSSLLHNLVCWIETALVVVLNLLIVAVATVIQAIFDALPSFPSVTVPTLIQDGFAYISYWFPMSWLLTNLTVFIAFCIAWFLIAIPLRTVRAVRGSE